jgi:hypothetical protein
MKFIIFPNHGAPVVFLVFSGNLGQVGVLRYDFVMLVCMASYITVGYGHANHAFRVNEHF